MEEKGLKINVGKTKVLCSRHDVSKLKIASVIFHVFIYEKHWSEFNPLSKLPGLGTQVVFWH